MDGHQTDALRLPLDADSVATCSQSVFCYIEHFQEFYTLHLTSAEFSTYCAASKSHACTLSFQKKRKRVPKMRQTLSEEATAQPVRSL